LLFSTCVQGQIAQIAVVVFNNWASQEFVLYENSEFVEVEWTVGPVPIDDNVGKEIILRYDTNIASQATFYTDANGREVVQRIRDFRPTWNYTVTEPVSGNYYPVNSRIYIKDGARQLTVLTGKTKIEEFDIEIG
jgi:lysosomal alpha-mannosidase